MPSIAESIVVNNPAGFSPADVTITGSMPLKNINCVAYNGKQWIIGGSSTLQHTTLTSYQPVIDIQNQYVSSFIIAVNKDRLQLGENARILFNYPSLQIDNGIVSTQNAQYTSDYNSYITYLKQAQDLYNTTAASGTGTLTSEDYYTTHTIAISTDGYTWNRVTQNPFSLGDPNEVTSVCNGFAWNGSQWVAIGTGGINNGIPIQNIVVGGGNYQFVNQIATSPDGINWTPRGIPGRTSNGQPFAVAANSSVFIIVSGNVSGITNTIAYPTTTKIYSPFVDDVPTICTSTDGINWKKIGNSSDYYGSGVYAGYDGVGGLFQGYGVAYNGAYWVAVGAGLPNSAGTLGVSLTGNLRSCIVFSSDNGNTWDQGLSNLASNPGPGLETYYHIFSVAWNGSYWLAVGQVSSTNQSILSSCVPIPVPNGNYNPQFYWSGSTAGVIIKSTNSIEWTVASGFPVFTDIIWDGNYWVATGQLAFQGDTSKPAIGITKRSLDGVTWETVNLSGNALASSIPLPILGGTLNTVSALLVGYGSPSSVLRTFDDTVWHPQLLNGQVGANTVGQIQKEFFGAVWTGSLWIIVGNPQYGNSGQSIATSPDGISWSYPTSTLENGKDIAWSGSLAVAVCEGLDTLISTSPDGITWTKRTPAGLLSCECVAWNGGGSRPMWIVGGNGGMNYSTDGITWNQIRNTTLTTVNSIAYNSLTWISVGSGPSHTINMSIDGIRWFDVNSATNPFTIANAIAWNGTLWVAVGSGANTIATSPDGYNWTGLGTSTFTVSGSTVSWTGTKWIASGSGLTSLATSTDGVTWTSKDILLTRGNCYVNKTASLPNLTLGSGVASLINSVIASTIVSQTNTVISNDAAAIALAANQAAAAAAAAAALALRNATKASAVTANNALSFWQTTITNQYTPLTDTSVIDLSVSSDSALFTSVTSTYNAINNSIITAGSYTLFINNNSNSQADIDAQLVLLQGLVTTVQGYLPKFYNQAAILYTDLVNAQYKNFTQTQNVSAIIGSWGFPSGTYTTVINAYNAGIAGYGNAVGSAVSFFASVINVPPTNSYTYPSAYSPPDFATMLSNTIPSSSVVRIMNGVFNTAYPYKQQADSYYKKAVADAQNWASVTGGTLDMTTITNTFAPYYTQYFYTTVTILPSPLIIGIQLQSGVTVQNYSGVGLTTNVIDLMAIAVKYFKVLSDEFSHPGFYPAALGTLYTSVKSALDTVDATKSTAISYAQNKRNTTVQTKLNDFKTTTRSAFPNGPRAQAIAKISQGTVTSITVTRPGNGYYSSSYNAVITGGGVSIANAEATVLGGHIASVTVLTPGSGYTSVPTVSFNGGGGTNATATASISNGYITGITLTNAGSGYTSAPTITISGGGISIATATVTVSGGSVTGITVTSGGSGYTSVPIVTIDLPLKIDTLIDTLLRTTVYSDSNYEIASHIALLLKAGNLLYPKLYPLIHAVHLADIAAEADGCLPPVTGWGSSSNNILKQPTVTLVLTNTGSITAINVFASGSQFISQPTISFVGSGTGAAATAIIGSDGFLSGVTVTNDGYGYTSDTQVVFVGGQNYNLLGTQGLHGWDYFNNTYYTRNALAAYILSHTISFNNVISNNPTTSATATTTISGGHVASITLTNGGSGYTDGTISVTFNEGGGSGATATATVANGVVTSVTLTSGGSGYLAPPTAFFVFDSIQNYYSIFHNVLTWTDFLAFTDTATYIDMNNDIQQFNTAVTEIESNSLFASATADTAASSDITAIQSEYVPFGQKYLASLVSGVSTNIPSSQDQSDFGYISFATPINTFNTFGSAVTGIQTDYNSLQLISINSGFTNSQINTALSNAESYVSTISSTQSNTQYQSIITGIPIYRTVYSNAQTYTNLLVDRVNRWSNMKSNAISMGPFNIGYSANGLGKPFIVSIPPSNSIYWSPVKYTIFSNLSTFKIEQCYSNVGTGIITALPTFSCVNTGASSVYRGTANYYNIGSFSKSDTTLSNINYSASNFTSNGTLFISSTTKDSVNVSNWLSSMSTSITNKTPSQASATCQLNTGSVSAIFITNTGSNYVSPPNVVISGTGTTDIATATATIGPLTNVNILTSGSGYTSVPTVAFSGGGASVQATAIAVLSNGRVIAVIITSPGSGYLGSPTVSFSGGNPSVQATATATVNPGIISSVTITHAGSGYSSTPSVTFTGGGPQEAIATASVANGSVSAVTLVTPGIGYASAPTIIFTGGGASVQATATASVTNGIITNISITTGGSGYTSAPTISFIGGITQQASGTALIANGSVDGFCTTQALATVSSITQSPSQPGQIASISITNSGSGYVYAPLVTFVGGGGSGATATTTINSSGSVTSITLTNPGTGYTSIPTIIIGAGIVITNAGSGFTEPPTITFSGGGGTGATATASIANGVVTSITITNGGTGYTTVPTVTFSGGSIIGYLRIYSISTTLNYALLNVTQTAPVSGGFSLNCVANVVKGSPLTSGNSVYVAFSKNIADFTNLNFVQNFSAYSNTAKYYAGQYVTYNNSVYTCILDNTDSTKQGIVGLYPPSNPANWKLRTYPYVTLNGTKIEADPTLLGSLTTTNCLSYSSAQSYNRGSIVLSTNFYFCSDDISSKGYLVGIDPTNTNYWVQTYYTTGYVKGILKEINPANFPALSSADNIPVYSSTASYTRESYVSFGGQYWFLIVNAGVTVTGVSPNSSAIWHIVTHPMAYVTLDGSIYGYREITSSNFPPLVASTFPAYSSTGQYTSGSVVKVNNAIYRCSYTTTSLINVNISNTNYWKQIVYPVVVYKDAFVEAAPGVIPALSLPANASDFPTYDATSTTYNIGDTVSIGSSFYECTNDVQINVPITGISPTNTTNWQLLNYPLINTLDELQIPVEADPSVLNFSTLNEQDYHEYNNNWLYRVGDLTSYNATVYECINVTPPNPSDVLTGVDPTTSPTYWKNLTSTISDYNTVVSTYFTPNGIVNWWPLNSGQGAVSYTVGSLVLWNGEIYKCEVAKRYQTIYNINNPTDKATLLTLPPNVDTTTWNKIDPTTLSVPIPPVYSPTAQYNVGSVVTIHLPTTSGSYQATQIFSFFGQTSYTLNFFTCITIDPNYPVKFKYPEVLSTDSIDEYGNLIPVVSTGNWQSNDTPRYGNPTEDPYAIFNFPVDLRRRVAMNIDFPYQTAWCHVQQYSNNLLNYVDPNTGITKYNFASLPVTTSSAATQFSTIQTAGNNAVTLFNNIETSGFIANVPVTNGGSGYTSAPTVTFTGGGYGTGAAATCIITNGQVASITLTSGGSNYSYTNPPFVVLTGGGGTGATAIASVQFDIYGVIDTAYLNVKLLVQQFRNDIVYYMTQINLIKTQYFNQPYVQAQIQADPYSFLNPIGLAGGNPPQCTPVLDANGTITGISIISPGISIGNANNPDGSASVTFVGGGVASVTLTHGGQYYQQPITVTFSGGSPIFNATATATSSNGTITGITITSAGAGYTSAPTITISGYNGTGQYATATATIQTPGTGAIASAIVTNGSLESITVINGGSGYPSGTGIVVNTVGGGHILCFRDLGVGDPQQILSAPSNIDDVGNPQAELQYYNEKTAIINAYKDEISTRVMDCRDLTGFAILTQMLNDNMKIGARINCPIPGIDIGSGFFAVTIDTPITEFKGVDNYHANNSIDDRIVGNYYTQGTYTYDDINSISVEQLADGYTYYINNDPILGGDLSGYSDSQIATYNNTNYHVYQWQQNGASSDPLHLFTHPGWVDMGRFDDPAYDLPISSVINCAIKESSRPPEYTLPGSLAQQTALAITYQTTDPTLRAINSVGKAVVGIAAAGFQNCFDPTQVTGLISFVTGQPLSFVPDITFPNFNSANQSVAILNSQIQQAHAANVLPLYGQTADTIGYVLHIISMLLDLNSKDIEDVQELIDSVPVTALPANEIIFPTPLPAFIPKDYVPVPKVGTPNIRPACTDAIESLRSEQESLLNLQSAVQAKLNTLEGLPLPNNKQTKTSIPKRVQNLRPPQPVIIAEQTISGKEFNYNEKIINQLISSFGLGHSRVDRDRAEARERARQFQEWCKRDGIVTTYKTVPTFGPAELVSDNLQEVEAAKQERKAQKLLISKANAEIVKLRSQIAAQKAALADVSGKLSTLDANLKASIEAAAQEAAANYDTATASYRAAVDAATEAKAQNEAIRQANSLAESVYIDAQASYKRQYAIAQLAQFKANAATKAAKDALDAANELGTIEDVNKAEAAYASSLSVLQSAQTSLTNATSQSAIDNWTKEVRQAQLDVFSSKAEYDLASADYAQALKDLDNEVLKLPAFVEAIKSAIASLSEFATIPYDKLVNISNYIDDATGIISSARNMIKTASSAIVAKIVQVREIIENPELVELLAKNLKNTDAAIEALTGVSGVLDTALSHAGMGIAMDVVGAALVAYSNGAFESSTQIDMG